MFLPYSFQIVLVNVMFEIKTKMKSEALHVSCPRTFLINIRSSLELVSAATKFKLVNANLVKWVQIFQLPLDIAQRSFAYPKGNGVRVQKKLELCSLKSVLHRNIAGKFCVCIVSPWSVLWPITIWLIWYVIIWKKKTKLHILLSQSLLSLQMYKCNNIRATLSIRTFSSCNMFVHSIYSQNVVRDITKF